jgi:hypothetical protein
MLHAQKNKTLNKHLTSKLQVSPNFTLDSVTDCNYRSNVGGFLIFEWTLIYHIYQFRSAALDHIQAVSRNFPTLTNFKYNQ